MCHCPTSPNTAPATKNDSPKCERNVLKIDETSFTMRGRSENDPRMKPSVRNPPRNRGYFSRSPRAFCMEKYNISRSGYHSKFHRILRLPRKVTLELDQILRLPRKVTFELHQILRVPRKVTLELHQILRLPRKVLLLLDSTTNSTAQGGGGSFKKRKTIGEIGCCESRMSKQKH